MKKEKRTTSKQKCIACITVVLEAYGTENIIPYFRTVPYFSHAIVGPVGVHAIVAPVGG